MNDKVISVIGAFICVAFLVASHFVAANEPKEVDCQTIIKQQKIIIQKQQETIKSLRNIISDIKGIK